MCIVWTAGSQLLGADSHRCILTAGKLGLEDYATPHSYSCGIAARQWRFRPPATAIGLKGHRQASTICAALVLLLGDAWMELYRAAPRTNATFFGRQVPALNSQYPSSLSLEPLLQNVLEQVEQHNPGMLQAYSCRRPLVVLSACIALVAQCAVA